MALGDRPPVMALLSPRDDLLRHRLASPLSGFTGGERASSLRDGDPDSPRGSERTQPTPTTSHHHRRRH